ncbi:Copia protein [Vitis vinifera]|uniref:Copia protein n=1 Tax=Vitis vinifera TaxID=29760 RepID=A0A438DW96_VITVI|nr:Copia protein [Vitis vinifera]
MVQILEAPKDEEIPWPYLVARNDEFGSVLQEGRKFIMQSSAAYKIWHKCSQTMKMKYWLLSLAPAPAPAPVPTLFSSGKREELLQYAQAAIAGLKVNADIVRIDAEYSSAQKKLDRMKASQQPSNEGNDKSSQESTVETREAITHSGQISLAISQSDHLSLSLSLTPVISPCSQSQGRKRFPVSRIVVRKHSPRQLFRRRFFLHRKECLEEISNLSQSTGTRNPSTRRHARFSGRRLHLTPRRVRAREPLSGDALPPPGSPDADQPPFLPVCAIRALHVPLLGFSCFRGPSDQIFRRPPDYFFSTPVPARALRSVLLPFRSMTKYGMASSQVSSVTSPESGGRSEIPKPWRKFLTVGTAKDIWDATKETYSSSENTSELFQVESALHDFRQGEQSVTQYYNTLTRYWQQLDLFETHSWKCSDDAATYRQIVEQKRLFKFFLGLNRELDDVRGRIMGIKPLPSLREAFSEVRREESRKKVMMGSKEQPAPTLDASALAARSFNSSGGDRQKRDRPWCDYCKKPGHYKETCWKLHEQPADWKPKRRFDRDGRAHVAANSESTSVPEPSPFNKEQMEMLQKLLSQVGSGSTIGVAFTANRGGMRPWIVDTGASDHMTGDAAILQNYKPSNGHSSVHIADGSKSKIVGTGSINLLKTYILTLSSMFQTWIDLKSGKMIGSAELLFRLYLLSCGQFSNQVFQASCVQSQTILTATYLINRMPSRVLTFQSPRQLFLKQFPHTHAASSDLPLKVFGCTAFVHVYPQNRSKFAPRANKCIFLGYSPTQKGYKCYSPTNKRFYTTMDVSFFEHVFFYPKSHVQGESMNEHQVWESFLEGVPSFHSESPNPSQFAPTELSTPMPPSVQPAQHTNVPSPVTIQSPMPIQPIAPQLANENLQVYIRRRKRQELEHGSQSTCGQYIDSNSSLPEENIGEDRAGEVLIPSIDDSTLPIALRKGVRRCTDHPIGNYVTYEGLSPSYRAFATSLDDTQVPNTIQEALKISEWKKAVQDEIDALEKNGTWTITDLPVGKRPVGCKWIFTIKYKQMDQSKDSRLVWILLSLAVNQDWCLQQLDIKNAFLNGDLEEEVYMEIPPGFEESMAKNQADHTLFVKKSHAGKLAILIVYVDDIILSGNDMGVLQNLKKYLSEEFEVKDLGNLKYFLGMEVARSRKGIVVSQRKYILDLLKKTGMLGCKPIDTPMDSQKKLGIEKESTPVDRGRYQRLVGRLIIFHTLGQILLCRKGLFFRKTENRDTEVYSDADWAGNIIDRRSTSGYCSFVWGNLVTWRSKKQSVVARSSAEAEYRALAQGICEGIWIKGVLSELGQMSSSPILMMCDNQAAISIAKNPVQHDRTSMLRLTDTLSQRR